MLILQFVGEGTGKTTSQHVGWSVNGFLYSNLTTCIHADCNILTLENFPTMCKKKKNTNNFTAEQRAWSWKRRVNAGFKRALTLGFVQGLALH